MYFNEISRRFKKFVWLFFAHSNGDPEGVQFGLHIQMPVCVDGFTVSKCLMSGPAVRYLALLWALDQILTRFVQLVIANHTDFHFTVFVFLVLEIILKSCTNPFG